MARSPTHYARLSLLLILTAGLGIFASSFGATLELSFEQRVLFSTGSDIRGEGVRPLFNPRPPFSSRTRRVYGSTEATPQSREALGEHIDKAQVNLDVILANTTITMEELLDLRVGDVITTDKDSRTPLQVNVNGTPTFQAFAGAFKGRKAIQIERSYDRKKPPQK